MSNNANIPEWKQKLQEMAKNMEGVSPPPQNKQNKKQAAPKQPNRPPRDTPPRDSYGGGGGGDDARDKYYLPHDTLGVLKKTLTASGPKQIDNFALLLNKCALHWQEKPPKPKRVFTFYPERDARKRKKELVVRHGFDAVNLDAIHARQRAAIAALGLEGADTAQELRVDWRLIVGLGGESVYETSMTLHHVYGIPYIPGQAVKGVVRSWMMLEYVAKKEKEEYVLKDVEKRAFEKKWFRDIFGCPAEYSEDKKARRGQIMFFDAFPTDLDEYSVQPDIMNSHYPDYYTEKNKKPPADYQSPNPVTFLTVMNTTFQFFVGYKPLPSEPKKKDGHDNKLPAGSPLDIVKDALPRALAEHGLGAKTAVGYGYFSA